ncbi:MAG: hypothetical protein DIU67_010635 [Actinomycetes bacterium]|jgi:hypothetical protein|nr:MAG: hypothetical protein DIU67_05320 [Actinomycetota bacterium]
MRKFDVGTFVTGLVFFAIGVAFLLESLGVWEIGIQDLRLVGPIALVVVGLVIILGAIGRREG